MFNMIANANLIIQLAIQIKNGIMKHANVSVKIILHTKTFIAEILAHALVKMVSIWKLLWKIQKLCLREL